MLFSLQKGVLHLPGGALCQHPMPCCRLLNLELLLQFGPRAWQAHIRHLEVAQQGYAALLCLRPQPNMMSLKVEAYHQ